MFVDISNRLTFARILPALSEHATCSGLLLSHPRTNPSGDESAIDSAKLNLTLSASISASYSTAGIIIHLLAIWFLAILRKSTGHLEYGKDYRKGTQDLGI
jgi:hypothetical protein